MSRLFAALLWFLLPLTLAAGEVSLKAVRSWKEPVLWIDARSKKEFAKGHIPGALCLNEENWESQLGAVLDAWKPECRVVVYCDSQTCETSADVAERLGKQAGLPKVDVLKGGWRAWRSRSL